MNSCELTASITALANALACKLSIDEVSLLLKNLLGGTIREMMEAEPDEHPGYDEYEHSDNPDYRNGVKHKTLRSS